MDICFLFYGVIPKDCLNHTVAIYLNILKNCQGVFKHAFLPHSDQYLLWSVFLILAILICLYYSLIVVLISISPRIDDSKCSIMSFFVTYILFGEVSSNHWLIFIWMFVLLLNIEISFTSFGSKSFIRTMLGKYVIQVYGCLFIHSLNCHSKIRSF